MLVLSRKVGEEIVVSNGAITISVLGVSGRKVRLGVSAPSEVPVHRNEIHHRISAATTPTADPKEAPQRPPRQFAGPAQSDSRSNALGGSGHEAI
jgi:carbon storage regulator